MCSPAVNTIAAISIWFLSKPSVNQQICITYIVLVGKTKTINKSLFLPFPIGPSIQTWSCKQGPDL